MDEEKKYDFKKSEEGIIAYWKEGRVFEKAKERVSKEVKAKNWKKYYFLDGPPYATGAIHMGTAWNKIIKDYYMRFWRMNGYDVHSQPGYDTHGLPIENKVEKKLGLKNKTDIEKYGVEKFVQKCRNFATEHIGDMNREFANLGVWMDWETPYITLENYYIEGAWHTFKTAFEKNFLYKGNYSVHVCPHCATAVAYNEIEHKKVKDTSIFIKFKAKGRKNEYFVIWTTTPWTLPANTGIMVNPKFEYSRILANGEILIVAKELAQKTMEKFGIADYKEIGTVKGADLVGVEYENPLSDIVPLQNEIKGRVVPSEQYVFLTDGTGLVHCAPGHGLEDYKVGIENKLPVVCPVGLDGKYDERAGKFAGMFVKKADAEIINVLRETGALLAEGQIEHEYPMCWRCASPLLMLAVPQWFFRVSTIKQKLIEENKKVRWAPEWAGKRFENWLESLSDWPISRQRYWGIPLPIWTCECGKVRIVGSAEELGVTLTDLHKPHIDAVELDCECGKKMRRIPDVLDVWFDSGVAPWASLHYPKEKEKFEELFPADFEVEGPDQIRGWWNSQIITSIITFGKAPFKNILFHGFLMDAHGIKMSKSKGNIAAPEDAIASHGRDALRLYLLSSETWNDFYFSMEKAKESAKVLNVLWNTYLFAKAYCEHAGEPKELNTEDRWLISKINSLAKLCAEKSRAMHGHEAASALADFVLNDLSRWYIKLIRDRTWPGYAGEDRKAACYTLWHSLDQTLKLLAPIAPFMTEKIYLEAFGQSVHLQDYPQADEKKINPELEEKMALAKEIAEAADSARQEAKIKLRHPVKRIVLIGDFQMEELAEVLKSRCNCKSVELSEKEPEGMIPREITGGKVFLDTEITKEILEESLLREVSRKIQELRKQNNLKVEEQISIVLAGDRETLNTLLAHSSELKTAVGAAKIEANGTTKELGSCEFGGKKIGIWFERI